MSILVATDGETVPNEPIRVGYDLARAYDTDLVVLHVMPQDVFEEFQESATGKDHTISLSGQLSYGAGSYGSSGGSGSSKSRTYTVENGERTAADTAEETVEGTLDEYEDVIFQGRVGEPVTELLDEADRRDAQYVVVGGRKRSPAGKALFGSKTQSILLNSERPVVTVMDSE